jgi:hypothetical protein
LIRIGHIQEGLRRYAAARQVYEEGQRLFPGRRDFTTLLARIKQHT